MSANLCRVDGFGSRVECQESEVQHLRPLKLKYTKQILRAPGAKFPGSLGAESPKNKA